MRQYNPGPVPGSAVQATPRGAGVPMRPGCVAVLAMLLPGRVEIGRPEVGQAGQQVIVRFEALGGDLPWVTQAKRPLKMSSVRARPWG